MRPIFDAGALGPELSYLDAYSFAADGSASPPAVLYWVATWDCNLRCAMCPLWSPGAAGAAREAGRGNTLTRNEVVRIVGSAADAGVRAIQITGGEPLLFPHVNDVVTEAKRRGLLVTMFTNGTLLTDGVARALVATGIDKVGVSLDGPEVVHDTIRGPGSFSRAAHGIQHLIAARREAGGSTYVCVMSTLSRHNAERIEELVDVTADLRADGMFLAHPSFTAQSSPAAQSRVIASCFLPKLTTGPSWSAGQAAVAREVQGLRAREVHEIQEHLKARALDRGVQFSLSLDMSEEELRGYYAVPGTPVFEACFFPWYGCFLDPRGRLYPCIRVDVADLRNIDLKEAWNGDIYRRFRRLVRARGMLPCCERCCQLVNDQTRQDRLQVQTGSRPSIF